MLSLDLRERFFQEKSNVIVGVVSIIESKADREPGKGLGTERMHNLLFRSAGNEEYKWQTVTAEQARNGFQYFCLSLPIHDFIETVNYDETW